MSHSSSIVILPVDRQFDGRNWSPFHDVMISLARGKGYEGYLNGTILRPADSTFIAPNTSIYNPSISTAGHAGTASMANALFPSQGEWDLRDAQMGAMIYQNIKDPKAHGLKPTSTSKRMWDTL
ncbi:hypothetical protein DFH09DRAFT_861030, partial [Mycena vulgaris]